MRVFIKHSFQEVRSCEALRRKKLISVRWEHAREPLHDIWNVSVQSPLDSFTKNETHPQLDLFDPFDCQERKLGVALARELDPRVPRLFRAGGPALSSSLERVFEVKRDRKVALVVLGEESLPGGADVEDAGDTPRTSARDLVEVALDEKFLEKTRNVFQVIGLNYG